MDKTVGTVDLPSIWNQRPRQGLWLHWDGNNDRVEERNKSAAIGAGATPKSLDLASMRRIEQWLLDFPAPKFPAERIDASRAADGRACLRVGLRVVPRPRRRGRRPGHADRGGRAPIRGRLDSFTPALATAMNTIGRGRPWAFSHFRKTQGYANMPLDGLWLRAPYLHNGSVPDLRALLFPEERPATFFRAYDVYDWDRVGFVSRGAGAEREGVRFDTTPARQRQRRSPVRRRPAHRRQARAARVPEDAVAARPSVSRPGRPSSSAVGLRSAATCRRRSRRPVTSRVAAAPASR